MKIIFVASHFIFAHFINFPSQIQIDRTNLLRRKDSPSLPAVSIIRYICEYFKTEKESKKLFPKFSPNTPPGAKANRDISRDYLTFFRGNDIIKYL